MDAKGIVNLVLRLFQFLWALLVMALTGNIIADALGGSSAVINYSIFCSVFAMLTLFFLIPASFKSEWGIISFLPFTLDLLNTIFWFAGAVALAAKLHVHSCNDDDYTSSNYITRNSNDRTKTCREAQASDAFLWFGWAAFLGSTVITGLALGGGSMSRPSRGVRRGPAMSQV